MKKKYSFGTEDWIELKPSSKFEFVHCLNVYIKKRYQFEPTMDPGSRCGKRGGVREQCPQKEMDNTDPDRRIWDKSTALVTISVNRVIPHASFFTSNLI